MALQIGFTNKYYTLWEVRIDTEHTGYGSYEKAYYTYIQNLSMDEDKAIEKAKGFGCELLYINEDLRGTNNRAFSKIINEVYDDTKFHRGKYTGETISECDDFEYMTWFYNELARTDQKPFIEKRVISLRPDFVVYDERFISKEEYDDILNRIKFQEKLNSISQLECLALKNISGGDPYQLQVEIEGTTQKLPINPDNVNLKEMEYRGFQYYLPVIDGKAKRIKNKNILITFGTIEIWGEQTRCINSIELVK